MNFTVFDFLIGFFLMNAMPHLLFGQFNIRMPSLFGLSSQGNLAYACFNVIMTLIVFHTQYGIQSLISNGILLGAAFILLSYVLTGKFIFNRFRQDNVVQ